jgi:nicotinamide-nucleotide amidase
MNLFPADVLERAAAILELCRAGGLTIVTAESCTGGLIAACFTEIAGASDVFERGYVTYSNRAKMELLGVDPQTLARFGAVSKETALEMAKGALTRAKTDLAIAVTGIAGPGGGSAEKPVGLVHVAVAATASRPAHRECRFGDIDRAEIRMRTLRQALSLTMDALPAHVGGEA